ncbi:MAG: nucleoside deaminase [archaeon]
MDKFMKAAISEAKKGLAEGGIPIGSVLVKNGRIIGRGHNMRVQKSDPLAHAEIECIRNAGRIKSYKGATLYSTLMPCFMCAGAVVEFKIPKVVAGESKSFKGACSFMEQHGIKVKDLGFEECAEMMRSFINENPALWKEDIGRL